MPPTKTHTESSGYYVKHEGRLLASLDRTLQLMQGTLVKEFGESITETLKHQIREEFASLIPEIPRGKGARARMFNKFLIITTQFLAAYKVLIRYGWEPRDIWPLCHEALRMNLEAIPAWKRGATSFFWNSLFVRILKKRGEREIKEELCGFDLEYLAGNSGDFDVGINYTRCGNIDFLKKHGGEALAPFICLSDMALSDAFGWGLVRTQTLADGCSHCDFRFKSGSSTRITSKTPEVQEFIDSLES